MSSRVSFLKRICSFGVDPSQSSLTNKRVELSNWIVLFALASTVIFMYYYWSVGLKQMLFIESGFFILYALPLVLNSFSYTSFSRAFLNTLVLVHIFLLCILLGYKSNMYTFFVPTIMAPFALFEFRQRRMIIGLSVFNVLLVSILYATIFRYNFSVFQLTDEQASIISKIVFYVSIGCCVVIIYSLLYVSERTTEQLDKDKESLSAQIEAIFDNSADGLFLMDQEKRQLLKMNKRAIELFEADSESDFAGKYGFDLHKHYPGEDYILNLRKNIEEKGYYEDEILYKTFKGNEFWASLSIKIMTVNGGRYQAVRLTDVSEKKKVAQTLESSLKEKEILLAEVHHRVKNNLAIISALINLQVENLKDEDSKRIFEETKDRIYSMALIHNQLYQNNSFARIEFSQYINNFCSYLIRSYQTNPNIEISESTEKVQLDIKTAIPCALILNELVTNSFKHAFEEQSKGKIDVGLKRENNQIKFWVADSGKGMKAEMLQSTTMGMNLVTSLVDQIDGDLQFENKNGTRFTITFGYN